MNRKPTKNTRGPNADEKRFMAWIKEQPCCICDAPGPSICDHLYGSTFRHNKVLIGMWALLPYCEEHDRVKTQGSHRAHISYFEVSQAKLWALTAMKYQEETGETIPEEVYVSIMNWGR